MGRGTIVGVGSSLLAGAPGAISGSNKSLSPSSNKKREAGLTSLLVGYAGYLFCFYFHPNTFRMTAEFRGVHTLDGGDSIGEISGLIDP